MAEPTGESLPVPEVGEAVEEGLSEKPSGEVHGLSHTAPKSPYQTTPNLCAGGITK